MKYTAALFSNFETMPDFTDNLFKFYPDGIVCKNSDLMYIYANNCYLKMFSIETPDLLLGKNENIYLSDKNIEYIKDADTEVKNYLHPINYIINTENNRILSVTSSPVIDQQKFAGLISCVRDITQEEIIKANFVNRHFKQLNAEKQLQQQRETFVASVGHDLKNPTIAQIRGLELLLKGDFGKLSDEQKELINMILDSCRYMNGMLSSMLDTYRNYGGVVKLCFSEFSLLDLVNECVSEMLYVARDKNIEIKIHSQNSAIITADRIQIRRVIMNLITNAIKYAYKNTTLNLKIFCESETAVFEFENKSPYISEDKQKSIFAKFVSYSGSLKELGIGLGLYSSKKIIEGHNGIIYVKSYEDDRNIFGFKIPQYQDSSEIKEISF